MKLLSFDLMKTFKLRLIGLQGSIVNKEQEIVISDKQRTR